MRFTAFTCPSFKTRVLQNVEKIQGGSGPRLRSHPDNRHRPLQILPGPQSRLGGLEQTLDQMALGLLPQAFDCGEDRRFQSDGGAHRLGCGSKLRFSEHSIGFASRLPQAFDCGEDRRFQSDGRAHRLGCG